MATPATYVRFGSERIACARARTDAWPTGPVTLGPVRISRLSDPDETFGKSRASSAAACADGALLGRFVAEFVVTEPRRPRNGSVITSRTTQKTIGYQGWRTIPRPSRENAAWPKELPPVGAAATPA